MGAAGSNSSPSMMFTIPEATLRRADDTSYSESNDANATFRQRSNLASQNPNTYSIPTEEDWLRQRQASSSWANLQVPQRENLLAYASQSSATQQIMELTRTVSQLAMANQQLTAAHGVTLTHVQALYVELRNERNGRSAPTVGDRRRPTEDDDACKNSEYLTKQRTERAEENKLRARIKQLEDLLKTQLVENANGEEAPNISSTRPLDPVQTIDTSRLDSSSSAKSQNDEIAIESSENRVIEDKVLTLSREIDRLAVDRQTYLRTNEKLLETLSDRDRTIEELTKNIEESERQKEQLELNLNNSKQQYDELRKEFDFIKSENERLTNELDVCRLEKDSANTEISNLKTYLIEYKEEIEKIKTLTKDTTSKLRTQLYDEISDKKKVNLALEDALSEIRRLKEIVETEERDDVDNLAVNENSAASQSTVELSDSTVRNTQGDNLEEFRKELLLKRKKRQRAIAAVSSEMERLRRELEAEKAAHAETAEALEDLRRKEGAIAHRECKNARVQTDIGADSFKATDLALEDNSETARCLEAQRLTNILKVSDELKGDIRLQIEKVDDLRYQLEIEPDRHRHTIDCLTEITNKIRNDVRTRERASNEIKDHLAQILVRVGDYRIVDVKDDIGNECNRQLQNILTLKTLYNQRLKILTDLKDQAVKELIDVKEKLDYTSKKFEGYEEDLKKAEEKIEIQDSEITNLESQLGLAKADCRDLQNQMSLINGLFSQMLLGASSADMDLDKLTRLLQENHDLISEMAREEGTEAAALPKLLLDLIEQVEGKKEVENVSDGESNNEEDSDVDKKEDDPQPDIAHNLPKVWRVLLELLSCHAVSSPNVSVAALSDPNSCYKSVDTPTGPRLVISVSKTYIRLKELILEKKHLEKEMNRMKQLNTHLESKLSEQEKRLSTVSDELSKTWNIVGRMQAQHQQLHTHEKILRYELQQKRKMLQELKQELEYCKEKWESARQKNTNTEMEWRILRREFAARKALAARDSFNNSAESGFSDERGDDSDEEYDIEGRIRMGTRRRSRKEQQRASTPDTESEQPTDTELSESKACSSISLEQRISTPETDTEIEETEVETDACLIQESNENVDVDNESNESLDILNPLDQALSTVIQKLISIDSPNIKTDSSSEFDLPSDTSKITDNASNELGNSILYDQDYESTSKIELPSRLNNCDNLIEPVKSENVSTEDNNDMLDIPVENVPQKTSNTGACSTISPDDNNSNVMSIFAIGPFPTINSNSSVIKNVQFSNPLEVGPSTAPSNTLFGAEAQNSSLSTTNEKLMKDEIKSPKIIESSTESDNVSIGSSSSVDTVKEFLCGTENSLPQKSGNSKIQTAQESSATESISSQSTSEIPKPTSTRTPEEVLAAREDRLKRLEEQANWLMKKMNATSQRGSALSTRLEELHEVYGEPPVPPPMPDVLPSHRLNTTMSNSSPAEPDKSSKEVKEDSSDKTS